MALVLRIKFPPTYPLIYKTVRIDAKLTTTEAINFIGESLNVPIEGDLGLYIPATGFWLPHDAPVGNHRDVLEDAEEVEFKDRNAKPVKQAKSSGGGDGGGCCVIS